MGIVMRNCFFVTLLCFVLAGCETFGDTKSTAEVLPIPILNAKDYKEYRPVDPIPVPFMNKTLADGSVISTDWSELSNEKIGALLPNQFSSMTIAKVDASGRLSYLVANTTADTGRYRVYLDYFKYRVERVVNEETKVVVGYGRVGVGMRLTAEIITKKTNVDLNSLLALGVAAKQGNVTGSITVDIIGIDPREISNIISGSSTIDETSIQKSLEALAVIRSRLSDVNTRLTPQIVSIKDN
ncbi:hypothetical protein [Pseudomonas yamanorum]|uniref:hypothetical protein n=1 Tax=Pseudomonas yamanorum TaxID=515393 RepID=UPI003B9EF45D